MKHVLIKNSLQQNIYEDYILFDIKNTVVTYVWKSQNFSAVEEVNQRGLKKKKNTDNDLWICTKQQWNVQNKNYNEIEKLINTHNDCDNYTQRIVQIWHLEKMH